MHRDSHHLCLRRGFGVAALQIRPSRGREVSRLSPAESAREARIVGVQRVRNTSGVDTPYPTSNMASRRCRHHCRRESRLPRPACVVWPARRADVPSARALTGQAHESVERLLHVLALGRLVDFVVIEPAPAVIDEVASRCCQGLGCARAVLQRQSHGVDCKGQTSFSKEAQHPPQPHPSAVFVGRFRP